VDQDNTKEMFTRYRAARAVASAQSPPWENASSSDEETGLPALQFNAMAVDQEQLGWTTLDSPLLCVNAGQGPYVSRYVQFPYLCARTDPGCSDMMQFPVSMPQDGLIDIMVWERVRCRLHPSQRTLILLQRSRAEIFGLLVGGAVEGEIFWSPAVSSSPGMIDDTRVQTDDQKSGTVL
jgi:hypothetical protein